MSISSQLPPVSLAQGVSVLQALARSGAVEAKVLGQQPNGTTQLQIGRQLLNLQLPSVPAPGSTLTFSAKQSDGQLTLTLLSTVSPAAQTQASSANSAPQSALTQSALTQMVLNALARQDSIVGLTTLLTAAVGKLVLPEPVLRAVQQVLAQQLPLDGGKLDAAALQRAVMNSGLFQEARLATGQQASGDLKTALLSLQKSLAAWLGDQAPLERTSSLPPPMRGAPPRARFGNVAPPNLPDEPPEAGKVLLERTEAALSRLRLHQNASLPDAAQRPEAQWSLDLPVTIAGHQHLLQLQIHRDAEDRATKPEDRGWQLRFAIHLGDPGEVGAQISMRGASTGVMIWAEDAKTASLLNENLAGLRQDLAAAGLNPGSVLVRSGAPPAPATPSRHLVDESR
ncbi:flagellar hook-length control protein FliK [Devosia rhizoryzae]|uniref:Flagellar hook-length control protein FliK n=1 Tax=Devosia rhizoryzae TaxID=2774137 RepID=A0ABX7CDH7_9HYPH|nr:flagellar hook-length control protein FliK [Devosia rhizoryzae]QQR40660.1 flagellar hook-length control protein FliK [Devosia rhizoryzae]